MGNLHSAAASGPPYGARDGKRRNRVRAAIFIRSFTAVRRVAATRRRPNHVRTVSPLIPPFLGARPKSNNAISRRLRRELSKLLFALLPPTDSPSSHHYLWGLRARHTACHLTCEVICGGVAWPAQQRLKEGESGWCKGAGFAVDTRSHDVIVPLTHLREAATRDDGPRATFYVVHICIPPRRGRKDRFRTLPSTRESRSYRRWFYRIDRESTLLPVISGNTRIWSSPATLPHPRSHCWLFRYANRVFVHDARDESSLNFVPCWGLIVWNKLLNICLHDICYKLNFYC